MSEECLYFVVCERQDRWLGWWNGTDKEGALRQAKHVKGVMISIPLPLVQGISEATFTIP